MAYAFRISIAVLLLTTAGLGQAAGPPDWPASITVNVTQGSPYDTVSGTVSGVDPADIKVVVFSRTNMWYIQPRTDAWEISADAGGDYQTEVNPWRQLSVFVVMDGYDALANQNPYDVFPLTVDGTNVLGMNSYPNIRFSGYDWAVKGGYPLDPGQNEFSESTENVWVDAQGRLHLKITEESPDQWVCAEVNLMRHLGYGYYHFQVSGDPKDLDRNVVASPFIYQDDQNELDIEFSRWCESNPVDAQFVVQPYTTSGNWERFTMDTASTSTHIIDWRADQIDFLSAVGLDPVPVSGDTVHDWSYTGADIPAEDGELVHINLWLCDNTGPLDGQSQEFIVESFTFYENRCSPPASGDWTISENCTLLTESNLSGNLTVQTGATLNFAFDAALKMDWTGHSLTVEGSIVIEGGGKILAQTVP